MPKEFDTADRPNTVRHTLYLHGGGEASDSFSDLWDNDAPQQEVFHYAGYEEAVTLEVDLDTGQWRHKEFNGCPIDDPKWYPVR